MPYIKTVIFFLCMTFLPVSFAFAKSIYTKIGEVGPDGELIFYCLPLEKARLLIDDSTIYMESDSNATSLCYLPNEYAPLKEILVFDSTDDVSAIVPHIPRTDAPLEENNISIGNIHIPGTNNLTEGNVHHEGYGNVNIGNTYIGGDNNISKDNTSYSGSNNTNIGNTHYAGSDNTAIGNTYEGSSNNTRKGETTYGASGKVSYNQTYSANKKATPTPPRNQADGGGLAPLLLISGFVLVLFWLFRANRNKKFTPSSTVQAQSPSLDAPTTASEAIPPESPDTASPEAPVFTPPPTPAPSSPPAPMPPPVHVSIPAPMPAPPRIIPPAPPIEMPKPKPPRAAHPSSATGKKAPTPTARPTAMKTKKYPAGTFVQVAFSEKYWKLYDYLIGDNYDVKKGDFVEVFVHSNGLLVKKVARVERISKKGQTSFYAKSNIVQKADGIRTWKQAEEWNMNA